MAQHSDKIGIKRMKRRHKVANFKKCHGSAISCKREHPSNEPKKKINIVPRMPKVEKKPSILGRVRNVFAKKKEHKPL